eukprot:6261786-Amphidinium_carterae.6
MPIEEWATHVSLESNHIVAYIPGQPLDVYELEIVVTSRVPIDFSTGGPWHKQKLDSSESMPLAQYPCRLMHSSAGAFSVIELFKWDCAPALMPHPGSQYWATPTLCAGKVSFSNSHEVVHACLKVSFRKLHSMGNCGCHEGECHQGAGVPNT